MRVRLTSTDGKSVTFVSHELKVGDRWYWVLNDSAIRAYQAGRCPGAVSKVAGTVGAMASAPTSYEVVCPHCKKSFQSALLGGKDARHRGFKCPHCRLFVPYERQPEPTATGAAPSSAG